MIYLLDVNALLALGVAEHEFHRRVTRWVRVAPEAHFATCAITEMGFLRVLLQAYAGSTISDGQKLLTSLRSSKKVLFQFVADDQDAAQLPQWVKWPKQITDGHLATLAKAHGAILATLDENIRSAFLIPR